jgi:hypothetical protein
LNKLSVKQKGLILVSLPLVFGILFISILVPLLFDFNSAVNKERASRAAIADGNRTFITVYQSICRFTNRIASKQEQEQKEFEDSLLCWHKQQKLCDRRPLAIKRLRLAKII